MDIRAKGADISSSTSPLRFLIATIEGRYLAFDAESVQEVLTGEQAGFLREPMAEGIVYPPVNLAAGLGLMGADSKAGSSVVLLVERGIRGSVRVEKVHGLLEIMKSQILPLPGQFRGPEQRWYRGMILFERSVALVLNTTWVLEIHSIGIDTEGRQGGTERISAIQGVADCKNVEC